MKVKNRNIIITISISIIFLIFITYLIYSKYKNKDNINNDNKSCQVINCHGLEIKCGYQSEPLACTEMYASGDVCRQYAKCGISNGECTFQKDNEFLQCERCVTKCKEKVNPEDVLECESSCN